MIKAVVFDLDDTLIAEKDYIKSGFKVVSKKFSDRYKLNEYEVFKNMMMLFEQSTKNVFNRLFENFNIEYSKENILEFIKIYREHMPDIQFFDDVIPTLNELKSKGYKLGIITDGYKETQNKKIEALNCKEIFDEIIITDELGKEFWKPNEKSYKLMVEKLGIEFNEMIYIGDNVTKDFITANKLGIETIHIFRKGGVYDGVKCDESFKAKYKVKNIIQIKSYI